MAGQVAVGRDGDEAAALRQPVQRLAQVLAGGTLHRRRGGQHALERTILGDPLRGRLRPDLLDAGHVVDRVADQRQVVDDALRRNAELGDDAGRVEPFVAHRVDQRDVLADELRQVLVAGRDDDLVAGGRRGLAQGADRIVRLDPGHRQHRPAEQLHGLVDRLDLQRQVIGHGRAIRLVVGIPVVAKGPALGVEHTGAERGRVLLAQQLQHRHDPAQRAGRHIVRARAGRAAHGRHGTGSWSRPPATGSCHSLVDVGPLSGPKVE